ncbi:MAG: hypothetical protein U5L06_03650 [Rhodovibrio sp.]|nr:hypothetical protein [Rhodovibrio sp.]
MRQARQQAAGPRPARCRSNAATRRSCWRRTSPHVVEVLADFSGQGNDFARFPDKQSFRVQLCPFF